MSASNFNIDSFVIDDLFDGIKNSGQKSLKKLKKKKKSKEIPMASGSKFVIQINI